MSGILILILRIGMAAVLYIFLGWALYILWRDLQERSESLASHQVPPIFVHLDNEAEEAAQRFTRPEVIIGRDPTCDLPLRDETVSVRHARFSYHHHQWWVEDLHSTNGTFINQERLTTPTVIVSSDELRFGQINLTVTMKEK
jgi:pSer/pThr/pTyr-binding forkhead associated (FHA) protein